MRRRRTSPAEYINGRRAGSGGTFAAPTKGTVTLGTLVGLLELARSQGVSLDSRVATYTFEGRERIGWVGDVT